MTDTQLTHTVIDYSVKETAAAIRKALRARWPGVKFSLTMSRGTGYGWMSLSWTDGPLTAEVNALTNGFRSSYFDGMDDSTHQIPATLCAAPDGSLIEHKWSCHGVNASRHYSPETEAWAETVAVRGSYWWPNGCEPYLDNPYYATRGLLAGIDLTNGFPTSPRESFKETWQR